jgi:hypothetical protein
VILQKDAGLHLYLYNSLAILVLSYQTPIANAIANVAQVINTNAVPVIAMNAMI